VVALVAFETAKLVRKYSRFARCVVVFLFVFAWRFITRDLGSGSDFLLTEVTRRESCSIGTRCLAMWLLVDIMFDPDPKRIVAAYREVVRVCPRWVFAPDKTIAILESAIWLRDKGVAESIMDRIEAKRAMVKSSQGLERLKLLLTWRFASDKSPAVGLLSPDTPHEAVLPYVDYYARATIADSIGNYDDALRYYSMALETLPSGSEESHQAVVACNFIRNKN
jgi:hypothetical protein